MAENSNWASPARSRSDAVALDQGLRSYMLGVYNYMAAGLAVTGLVAYVLSRLLIDANGHPTQLMLTLFASPLRLVVSFAPLALLLFISFRMRSMSLGTAQISYWAFSALMGLSLTPIFLVYAHVMIAKVFFITAASFLGLSLWGYTTKRDLSGMGSFLLIGAVGIFIAMLINMFTHSPAMDFAISVIGVLVFAGFTAYDTQNIKEMYFAGDDTAVMGRKSIYGALNLYLDFINLFLFLLRLMGDRR